MKVEPLRIYAESPTGRVQWSQDEAGRWFRRYIGGGSKGTKGWALADHKPPKEKLVLASLKKTRLPKEVEP